MNDVFNHSHLNCTSITRSALTLCLSLITTVKIFSAELSHCHSRILFTSTVPEYSSSSFAGSTQTSPTGCKTTVHNIHSTPHNIIKNPPLPFSPLLLCCFPQDHVVSKAQLMNSGQLVELKFIDRTATSQPAFLPGCVALIVQSVRSICY